MKHSIAIAVVVGLFVPLVRCQPAHVPTNVDASDAAREATPNPFVDASDPASRACAKLAGWQCPVGLEPACADAFRLPARFGIDPACVLERGEPRRARSLQRPVHERPVSGLEALARARRVREGDVLLRVLGDGGGRDRPRDHDCDPRPVLQRGPLNWNPGSTQGQVLVKRRR